MDFYLQLLKEHSRKNADIIANAIGKNKTEFKKIISILYNSKPPLPQRASWLLPIINKKHPSLLTPYLSTFIDSISDFKIDGIKRNMLSVLASRECPHKLESKLIDVCFSFLLSQTETVAVKVHAMQVLANLSKKYPELKSEIIAAIEVELPKESKAFSARANMILKKF